MLTNEQYTVHGKLVATLCQRISDGRVDFQLGMSCGALATPVVFSNLLDVQRHNIHGGSMVTPLPAVALEEPVHNML